MNLCTNKLHKKSSRNCVRDFRRRVIKFFGSLAIYEQGADHASPLYLDANMTALELIDVQPFRSLHMEKKSYVQLVFLPRTNLR